MPPQSCRIHPSDTSSHNPRLMCPLCLKYRRHHTILEDESWENNFFSLPDLAMNILGVQEICHFCALKCIEVIGQINDYVSPQ